MKILEWNIHKMTNSISVAPFVYKRICGQDADIICLVEYLDDAEIKNALENNNYWIRESKALSGNKILIAVSKAVSSSELTVIRDTEEPSCYNFLHVRFRNHNNENLSIIGVRMLSPIDASKQTPPLNRYLASVGEAFICLGDFNIKLHRMRKWFPDYSIINLLNKTEEIDSASIVYTDKDHKITDFGAVDHIISSENVNSWSEYSWDFIVDHKIYPSSKKDIIRGNPWYIPAAYPDHAILSAEVII